MSMGSARAAVGTVVVGWTLAAVALVGGWSLAAVLAVVAATVALAGLLLLRTRRPAPRAPADDDVHARRADGPWPAYDRRRSAAADAAHAAHAAPQPAASQPARDARAAE